MYNPINNNIEDEERLKEKDLREKNKKIRYQARGIQEAKTKQEMEDKMKRDADMSMRKVSHMRVREEIERGFDILSNGNLQAGLAKMNATDYMQKQNKAWDKLNPNSTACVQATGETAAATPNNTSGQNVDFNANRFATRSKRLNTNLAKAPAQIPAAAASDPAKATPSNRVIRTSGFQKLGEGIVTTK